MGSLSLWGRSIQEVGGDVVIGRSIYVVVVIDGSLYSRFYGRSVEFMHRLGCYVSCNEIYLMTILKHFACGRI